jgi:hypothetical protein
MLPSLEFGVVEVDVQWLDLLVSWEAAGGFILASLNCLYFIRYARETHSPSRKVGAVALVVIQAGLALEALLFLSQAPLAAQSWARTTAVIVVRSALFFSTALVSVLIWRSLWSQRP